ncbi:MAG: hypothetical protein J5I90_00495 [Caldilineales bacterium]|nr:hypothetical protein [Caldilineales bacterium]
MDKTIWDKWISNLNWISERISANGGEVEGLEILSPIPLSQVDEFNRLTGLSLPEDFVETITKFAGGFYFAWSLYEASGDSDWSFPWRGGNWDVPFIGASKAKPLIEVYNEFQNGFLTGSYNWIHRVEFDDNEDILLTRATLRQCFPLYLDCGGGGDFLVLRLDTDPSQILYLDHEWGFSVSGRAILGYGFVDFVTLWSNLGYPEVDRYSIFFDEERWTINDETEMALEWISWLNEK